jgi:hypothetical protein
LARALGLPQLSGAMIRFAIVLPLVRPLVRPLAGTLACAAAVTVLSSARSAAAFGGTADRLGQQGNFVISNRANLGFDQGLSYGRSGPASP